MKLRELLDKTEHEDCEFITINFRGAEITYKSRDDFKEVDTWWFDKEVITNEHYNGSWEIEVR